MPRPVILEGAKVLPMTPGSRPCDALAFGDGRILAVGSREEVRRVCPEGQRIDLTGRAVIPGFVDAHHHFMFTALFDDTVDCSPGAVNTIADIKDRLLAACRLMPKGAWVVGQGYNQWLLAERRHPDMADLDEVSRDHPVLLLHFSGHSAVANAAALAAAGVGPKTPNPPGGLIGRRRGRLTGQLYETAYSTLETLARRDILRRNRPRLVETVVALEARLFSLGVTRICDPTVSDDVLAFYRELKQQRLLRLPVHAMPVSEEGYLSPPWDKAAQPPLQASGAADLFVGPLKLFFDGGDRCAVCLTILQALQSSLRMAADVFRSRSLAPLSVLRQTEMRLGSDGKLHSGLLFYQAPDAKRIVRQAAENGHRLAIHAVGNEAFDMAVEAIAASRSIMADDPPPRIEHAVYVNPKSLKRAADLGIMIVTQPAFLPKYGEADAPLLPGLKMLPLRSMLEAGLAVASSSDAPITWQPLDALRSAVTRAYGGGRQADADEAISAEAWLPMATREGARAAGSLGETGTLEPGKRADLVVLSADPRDEAELAGLRVLTTVLAGDVVFGSL